MTKILREPLLYFLLLGVAMFGAYRFISDAGFNGAEQRVEIVITEGQVDALILGFERVWQRLPSQSELDGLIAGHVREEVMYREALAMGLDRDDAIIRRRLQQKLEFITEDITNLVEPTEAELQDFLTSNQDLFREQSRFSFEQVYFNVSERGASAKADAELQLAELREHDTEAPGEDSTIDAAELGDRLLLSQSRFINADEREILRAMGSQFLEGLQSSQVGSWQGPIESGFGLHLVKISEKIDGMVPALAEIRDLVSREWMSVKRVETNEAFYAVLLERYIVTLAEPIASEQSAATASSQEE